MLDLAITESTTELPPFDAREPWNASGLLLHADATYEIRVSEVHDWRDDDIPADPERGHLEERWLFKLPLIGWLRRYRKAPWYALMGSIGHDSASFFTIGRSVRHTPDRTGELFTFANDARGFYRNNHGTLRLTVTRLA